VRSEVAHPIEHLRWLARVDSDSAASLASEVAYALGDLAEEEPTALLMASKRLLDRHPACGPLWWACARLVEPVEHPREVGRRAAAELCSDPTPARLGRALRGSFTGGEVLVLTDQAELSLAAFEASRPYEVRLVGERLGLGRSIRWLDLDASIDVTGWGQEEGDEAVEGASLVVVEALAAGPTGVLAPAGTARLLRSAGRRGVPAWAVVGVGRALPAQLFAAAAERAGGTADELPAGEFASAVGPNGSGQPAAVFSAVSCPPGPELLRRPI